MKKLMSRSLDVTDFILNEDLQKLAEVVEELSDSVKTAHVQSLEELGALSESNVALILWHPSHGKLQKFATTTPELVEINMAFLDEEKNSLPEEVVKIAATNLTCAAFNYGIQVPEGLKNYHSDKFVPNTLDIRTINEKAFVEKTSEVVESIEKYAWAEEKKYPLHTELAVKKAASYFDTHHQKMDTVKKIEFINNTMEAAQDIDIELSGTAIQKYSELRDEFNEDFFNLIQVRKGFIGESDTASHSLYDDLIKQADDLGAIKTAEALYKIDEKVGLLGRYGHGVEDPMVTTMAFTKEASRVIDGVTVTREKLANVPDMDLAAVVGNGVVSELRGEEALDILESLPTPIKKDVINLL
jgi:hypothetical protein